MGIAEAGIGKNQGKKGERGRDGQVKGGNLDKERIFQLAYLKQIEYSIIETMGCIRY